MDNRRPSVGRGARRFKPYRKRSYPSCRRGAGKGEQIHKIAFRTTKHFNWRDNKVSVGIDELFDMLSWNSDQETQKKGIEMAQNVKCFSVFLQPHGLEHSKDVWENCARILAVYPDETLKYCLQELLEWLEDMNWPGAEIVLQRLIKFQNPKLFSIFLVDCVKKALACDNQAWLGNMSALLKNEELKDSLSKDIYNILYCRYRETE